MPFSIVTYCPFESRTIRLLNSYPVFGEIVMLISDLGAADVSVTDTEPFSVSFTVMLYAFLSHTAFMITSIEDIVNLSPG